MLPPLVPNLDGGFCGANMISNASSTSWTVARELGRGLMTSRCFVPEPFSASEVCCPDPEEMPLEDEPLPHSRPATQAATPRNEITTITRSTGPKDPGLSSGTDLPERCTEPEEG
nr:unnamed protein product [Digitaria exilis]